jgi:hypothetical protein
MILVPYSPDRQRNERRSRPKPYHVPCLLCGRPVHPERAPWVHLHQGGASLVTEAEAQQLNASGEEGGDMLFFPIGPECWRKHPELHPYQAKATT